MPRPDFFVMGAAKCGTTAVSTYLRGHEQIFLVSEPKELNYFCEDMPQRVGGGCGNFNPLGSV